MGCARRATFQFARRDISRLSTCLLQLPYQSCLDWTPKRQDKARQHFIKRIGGFKGMNDFGVLLVSSHKGEGPGVVVQRITSEVSSRVLERAHHGALIIRDVESGRRVAAQCPSGSAHCKKTYTEAAQDRSPQDLFDLWVMTYVVQSSGCMHLLLSKHTAWSSMYK